MNRSPAPRMLAVAAATALIAGLMVLAGPAAFASYHQSPQVSPSGSATPTTSGTPAPTASGGESVLPSIAAPTDTSSAVPSDTASATESASPETSVLGEQIPKTGAGTALPLLIGGTALAIASYALHRRLSRSRA